VLSVFLLGLFAAPGPVNDVSGVTGCWSAVLDWRSYSFNIGTVVDYSASLLISNCSEAIPRALPIVVPTNSSVSLYLKAMPQLRRLGETPCRISHRRICR